MIADERLEGGFAELFGGASGFGDREFTKIIRDETGGSRTGLTVSSHQTVARRQLIGSIAVLGMIAVFAAVTALRPVHTASVAAVSHPFPSVQQPIIETPGGDRLAAIKHRTELP
jgi:hypothetical protein